MAESSSWTVAKSQRLLEPANHHVVNINIILITELLAERYCNVTVVWHLTFSVNLPWCMGSYQTYARD